MRVILILTGLFTVIAGLSADKWGYGDRGSFGTGQLILLVFGCIILMSGIFGKDFFKFYKDGALIFLNLLILVAAVEMAAIVSGRLIQRGKIADIENLPYYTEQTWTERHWLAEKAALQFHYKPFVIWNHAPFASETINSDAQGFRMTPDSENRPNSFKIFMFGGSTMYGYGSPDWGTIPAYFQHAFNEQHNNSSSICIKNYAQDGYVATQSLISLMLQLQNSNIPDAIIFYDGVNEIIAAIESGQAGMHVTLAEIAARYEEKENLLIQWYKKSRQYALVKKLIDSRKEEYPKRYAVFNEYHPDAQSIDSLAESMVEKYLVILRTAKALANEYSFKYFFFLQPNIIIGDKVLTKDEQQMRAKIPMEMEELTKSFYEKIAEISVTEDNLFYLGDTFDKEASQIWIDGVSHVTPVGNQIIAKRIYDTLKSQSL